MGSREQEHPLIGLGDRLRCARLKARFKNTLEAARAAGIGKGSLDSYESGRNKPGADALAKLASAYGIPLDELVGRVPSGSIIMRPDQTLVDRALIDKVLATTNAEEIRDLLNWETDLLLCMLDVPAGAEVMERSDAQRLWGTVLRHVEEHAPLYCKLWRKYHMLPPWLKDGHV